LSPYFVTVDTRRDDVAPTLPGYEQPEIESAEKQGNKHTTKGDFVTVQLHMSEIEAGKINATGHCLNFPSSKTSLLSSSSFGIVQISTISNL
jgi:hypothetical protein